MRLWVALALVPVVAWAAPAKKAANPKNQAAEQAARGDAWAVANRCDEAVKAYRQSLALQPKNPVIQVRMAHCLAKTGGAAEAKQLLGALAEEPGAAGPVGAAGARRPGAAVGRLRRRRHGLRQAPGQGAHQRRRARWPPRLAQGSQRRWRRRRAHARHGAGAKAQERPQGRPSAAAARRRAGGAVPVRRRRQRSHRRQTHAGDG